MTSHHFIIRIKTPDGTDMDWVVQSPPPTFEEVLEVVRRVVPNQTILAFEYEDEDGDRVTVRSGEELTAMIAFYFSMLREYTSRSLIPPPLNIYPRVSKPAGKRNIHGLTVNTRAPAAAMTTTTTHQTDMQPSSSVQRPVQEKETVNIKEILAQEQVKDTDISFLEVLGHGHSGSVYKSIHRPTGKIMAIKVIPLDITLEVQKRIMSELQILYKCDSPVIIKFYGSFFAENKISICTEFMDGGSLEMYKCIPEIVLGRITVSIVKGLNYLWKMKIMHRDVKPSNVLVNTRGEIKLCDFGVSAQLEHSITKTYVGTNAYMAPERVLGDEYGVHSEVWSLGVFLLELALGKFPYPVTPRQHDLSAIDLLQCIVHENPPQLPSEHFSGHFVDFVSQCMQKLPSARPKPKSLMEHPFIQTYDDNNSQIIAEWVCESLKNIKSREQNQHHQQ